MKNELKVLYKKDPKLAKEVAKVLGYSIKVKTKTKAASLTKKEIQKKILEPLNNASKTVLDAMDLLADSMDKPDIERLGLKAMGALKNLRDAVKKV